MIYHFSLYLKQYYSLFSVVHYISFRIVASLLTSIVLSFILGSKFIERSEKFRSKIREYVPETHQLKNDTPTMGGLFVMLSAIIAVLLWCNWAKLEIWIFLLCFIGFGAIGFWDDWNKIKFNKGIKESSKLKAQVMISAIIAFLWYWFVASTTVLCVPFFKNINLELGVFILFWIMLVLIATSNAVNIADGLDGLAIGSLLPNFAMFIAIAYLAGNAVFAHYLYIPFVATSEMSIVSAVLVGSSLGFYWYNTYPAQVFMGDVGSLSLGAALGFIAIMTRQELLLIFSGGLFVVETASVIIQVVYYKLYRKRFFKMAPIHHHFELNGWPETKITTGFAIITFVLCLFALLTLKLR